MTRTGSNDFFCELFYCKKTSQKIIIFGEKKFLETNWSCAYLIIGCIMKKLKVVFILVLITPLLIYCSNNGTMKIEKKRNGKSIIYKPEKATYSGHYLKLIPVDPNYSPSEEIQKELINILRVKFTVNEIESHLSNRIEFIDAGVNFDSITCNICFKNIDMENWSETMSEWYKKNNSSLEFKTPCCNKKSNLNDLIYDSPSGFSKYMLSVNNAEYIPEYVEEARIAIQEKTEVKMRIIWARY